MGATGNPWRRASSESIFQGRCGGLQLVAAETGPRRGRSYTSKTLPGFMMPLGSSAALIPRITAISASLRVPER